MRAGVRAYVSFMVYIYRQGRNRYEEPASLVYIHSPSVETAKVAAMGSGGRPAISTPVASARVRYKHMEVFRGSDDTSLQPLPLPLCGLFSVLLYM